MRAVKLTIHGKVQGVFFRQSTLQKALKLGIAGWVRNCDDGTVEAVAEGSEEKMKAFTRWCHTGPDGANVSRVEESEAAPVLFKTFEIRR